MVVLHAGNAANSGTSAIHLSNIGIIDHSIVKAVAINARILVDLPI